MTNVLGKGMIGLSFQPKMVNKRHVKLKWIETLRKHYSDISQTSRYTPSCVYQETNHSESSYCTIRALDSSNYQTRTTRISVIPTIEPNLTERARIATINLDDYQHNPITPPPSPSSPLLMAAYQQMIAETDPT
ncbi:hypothetical protein Tco_0090899 [Tanacetum coccineum]